MALLAMTAAWAKNAGRRLVAITVDHGLNPDSTDWSRRCQAAARAVGADWVERRWEGEKPTTGLPAAARRARHGLIADAARAAGAKVVLFAHTADDVAESDWMRERGATLGRLRAWSPSPAWPEGRGLMLLRPMLDERREALRGWLRTAGSDWIEDPGNAGFGRGRARTALNPLQVGKGLSAGEPKASGLARKGEGRTSPEAHDPHPFGLAHRSALRALIPLPLGEGFGVKRAITSMELAAVLLCASGTDTPPRRDRLDGLFARLTSGEDFAATLSGARIVATGDRIRVAREPGELRRRPAANMALRPGVPAVWDGRYEITVRAPGRTVTAALGRLAALSKPDRAIVNAVAPWARGALPVLIRDDGTAPVLAWGAAEVRALGPRRLALALGETTQESDLDQTIHGETPPPDLF